MLKNHVFGSFNLNISEKYRLSFEDIFWGILDTYTKKMNPPSIVLGRGARYGLLAHSLLHLRYINELFTNCCVLLQYNVNNVRSNIGSTSSVLIEFRLILHTCKHKVKGSCSEGPTNIWILIFNNTPPPPPPINELDYLNYTTQFNCY